MMWDGKPFGKYSVVTQREFGQKEGLCELYSGHQVHYKATVMTVDLPELDYRLVPSYGGICVCYLVASMCTLP